MLCISLAYAHRAYKCQYILSLSLLFYSFLATRLIRGSEYIQRKPFDSVSARKWRTKEVKEDLKEVKEDIKVIRTDHHSLAIRQTELELQDMAVVEKMLKDCSEKS